MKLSVTIITFNEEKKIEACLQSVQWADEIVVVDSHSTDRTVEICRRYTDRVIIRDWPGHIKQKNFAVAAARHDWIFSLDADERASDVLQKAVHQLCAGEPAADGYLIPRKTFYIKRWIMHNGWYPDAKIRLFNRQQGEWAGEDPHDSVVCRGTVAVLSGDLLHYSFDSLDDHLQTIQKFTAIAAEEKRKKGKQFHLWQITLRPLLNFVKMYILQRGFLDGIPGFMVAVLSSYHVFIKYARLWETPADSGSK